MLIIMRSGLPAGIRCSVCILKSHMSLCVSFSRTLLLLLAFLESFYTSVRWWFSLVLSDTKSPQVSRTLLSILADLNHAAVWMVSTCLISKTFSLFTYPFGIVSSASSTISTTVTFIFHSFFLVLLQGLGTYLSFYFLLFSLCSLPGRQSLLFSRFLSFFYFFFLLLSLGGVV